MEEAKWVLSEVTRGTSEEKNLTLGQMLSGDNGSAQQRVMSLLCLLSSTNKAHRCFDKYEQEEMYRRERRKRQDAERRRRERYLYSLYSSREKAKGALYLEESNSATSSSGSRLSFTSESGKDTASTAFLHLSKGESTSPELTVGNSIYPSCGDTAFSFSAIPSGLGEARVTSLTATPSQQLNDLEGFSPLSSPPGKDVGSTSPTLEKSTETELLAFIPTRSVWSQLTYELLKSSSERKQWASSGTTANALCSCFDCACDSQPSYKTFQEVPGPSTTTPCTSLWDDAGNDNRYEREFQELAEFLLT